MNHSIVTCAYCHEDIERPIPETDKTKNGKLLAEKRKKIYGHPPQFGGRFEDYEKKYRNCHIIYRGHPRLGETLHFELMNIVDVYHPCCLSIIMKLGIEKANEPYQGTVEASEVCE